MRIDVNHPAPFANPLSEREDIEFAHPSEQEFANLLDFYGIRWQYEPYTFPLRWDKQGNVIEAFTPDFYLVDQDLFVELTTLRQSLMRIKRRKIRLLRALYPNVRIKMWERKDFEWLLRRFGRETHRDSLIGKQALEGNDE